MENKMSWQEYAKYLQKNTVSKEQANEAMAGGVAVGYFIGAFCLGLYWFLFHDQQTCYLSDNRMIGYGLGFMLLGFPFGLFYILKKFR